jgi:hypothetical protein
VKHELLEQTARYWGARTNKEDTCGRELARGSFSPKNEAMTDVFARCFKKIAVQVCTKFMITYLCLKGLT